MNFFGHMADDLTMMETAVDAYQDIPNAKALKAALQRAFVEACIASRAQRLVQEASGQPVKPLDRRSNPVRNVQDQLRRAIAS